MARRELIGNQWTREERNAINDNFKNLFDDFNNVVEVVSEKAYGEVVDAAKLNWLDPVDDFDSLPTGEEGDTRMARDTGKVYRHNGSEWREIQQIDAGPVNEVDQRLSSQLAQTNQEIIKRTSKLQPSPASGIEIIPNEAPLLIGKFENCLWGTIRGEGIFKKVENDEDEWELYTGTPVTGSTILKMLPTADNEVLIIYGHSIYKSTGWSAGDVNWDLKVEANGSTSFYEFSVDGYNNKFIAGSYAASDGFPDSRYIRISLDAGSTWNIVYNSVAEHGQEVADQSHLHAVAYDRWRDRFYFAEGHGPAAGIYCSEDDGQTWIKPEGMIQEPAPTTMTATPTGLVCGSDHRKAGLYGIVSLDDVSKQEIVQTWRWPMVRDGVPGFAWSSYYDESTGLVYVGFISEFDVIDPIIAAGTTSSGGLVLSWPWTEGTTRHIISRVYVSDNEVLAHGMVGSERYDIRGKIDIPGILTYQKGNLHGGKADENTSISVGEGSVAEGDRSTVVGISAEQSGNTSAKSTAIGYGAKTSGSSSTAIGANSETTGYSVALGADIKVEVGRAVALGMGASVGGGSGATAVGVDSYARSSSVSIGERAESTPGSERTVAIGENAKSHSYSVALGANTETTSNDQFAIGDRHLELSLLDGREGYDVPEGKGRMFLRENGDRKIELCVQFSGSPVIILGTQS